MNGLKAFRAQFKIAQQELADAMGLPFRTYQDVEAAPVLKPVHVAAMERASLKLALKHNRPMIALAPMRAEILDFYQMVRGERVIDPSELPDVRKQAPIPPT